MKEHVFAIEEEDHWVPLGCRDWPEESQPRLYYRIPTAAEIQEIDLAIAKAMESAGLGSGDVVGAYGSTEVRDLWVELALEYVTRAENFSLNGREFTWSDNTEKERTSVLLRLGQSGRDRLLALGNLISTIKLGMPEEQKKRSSSTSGSGGETTSPDASAEPVAEP